MLREIGLALLGLAALAGAWAAYLYGVERGYTRGFWAGRADGARGARNGLRVLRGGRGGAA